MMFSKDGKNYTFGMDYGSFTQQQKAAVKSLRLKIGDTLYVKQSAIAGDFPIRVTKDMTV